MHLIVGLGNPGKKYENTRHNAGSRIIDELENLNLENVVLAKLSTFMNESGKAVKSLAKAYDLKPNNLIVIHDDLDLPLGAIKIVKNRGAAGHKGVQSIIDALATKNFIRFRIGICPKQYYRPFRSTEKFVLQKFTKDEEKILEETVKKTAEAVETAIKKGIEKAMSLYNK